MAGATAAYIRTLRGGRSAEAVRVGVSKGVSMCLSVFIAMALSRLMEAGGLRHISSGIVCVRHSAGAILAWAACVLLYFWRERMPARAGLW